MTMPVRRDSRSGGWFFRTTASDGKKLRLFGTPGVPGPYHDLAATKVGATEAEQRAIREVMTPEPEPKVIGRCQRLQSGARAGSGASG